MATRNPILLRSHWIINNQLTLPWIGYDNGRTSVRGLIQLVLPVTIFLDTMFNDAPGFTSRSLGNDRYPIYKTMEGVLQTMGLDGKSCLLRTICEMQSNPISEFTVVGEIITILLKPNSKGRNDFLYEYIEAEKFGQASNMSCAMHFPSCPVSLFNLFDSEQETVEDVEREVTTEEPFVRDPLQELDDYLREHLKPTHHSYPKKPSAQRTGSYNSIDY